MLVGTPTSGTKKRMASIGSAGELAALGTGSEGRKRLRGGTPGQGQEKDVVLVSSDGARIPFSSRLLSASSPVWDSLMPPTIGSLRLASPFPASPSASPAGTPAPGELPEVHLPESADCLRYVLKFLEHKPVVPREVHFSRDWETIWRLIDHLTLALSRPTLPVTHLAPAFAFSLLFHLPDLSRSVAVDIAKALPGDECVFEEVAEGLERAKREWGIEGDGVEKLLTYLLSRTLVLSSTRTRALTALKSFDDAYDCKHSCRGLVYAQLCSLLTTSSRKRVRRVEEEVNFDCKDCDIRWDKVVKVVKDGLAKLPECPFGREEEPQEGEGTRRWRRNRLVLAFLLTLCERCATA